MRLLLLVLMIVLQPLHGLLGDVMAMEVPVSQFDAIKNIADGAYSAGTVTHIHENSAALRAKCHDNELVAGNVQAGADPTELQDHPAHDPCSKCGSCSNCNTCQICHTVAVPAAMTRLPDAAMPPLLGSAGGIRFVSAFAAPRLKPPIF